MRKGVVAALAASFLVSVAGSQVIIPLRQSHVFEKYRYDPYKIEVFSEGFRNGLYGYGEALLKWYRENEAVLTPKSRQSLLVLANVGRWVLDRDDLHMMTYRLTYADRENGWQVSPVMEIAEEVRTYLKEHPNGK